MNKHTFCEDNRGSSRYLLASMTSFIAVYDNSAMARVAIGELESSWNTNNVSACSFLIPKRSAMKSVSGIPAT